MTNRKEYLREYYLKNKEDYRARNGRMTKAERKIVCDRYYQNHKKEILERVKIDRYQRLYGLTLDEVDALLIKQDHKCVICGKLLEETRRAIDHDHETGQIRGILCYKCNMGLGHFDDNPELLQKALDYLQT